MITTESPLNLRLLTVNEYHQMISFGIFTPQDKIELINGQLITMSPKGTAHSAAVKRIEKLLESLLGSQVLVRLQDPVTLTDYSEPEPDIAVVKVDINEYEDHHPTPDEIYLILEVADTTLKYDCGKKAQIYAQSGIKDYWVLNISDRQLLVFREPTKNGYNQKIIFSEHQQLNLLNFPEKFITVSQMLRPLN